MNTCLDSRENFRRARQKTVSYAGAAGGLLSE
jgi:hypothetical protein